MERRCRVCGKAVEENLIFCPFCGVRMERTVLPQDEDDGEANVAEPIRIEKSKHKRTLTFAEFKKSGKDAVEVEYDGEIEATIGDVPETAINRKKRNQTLAVAGVALLVVLALLILLFTGGGEVGYRIACDQISVDGWVYDIYSDDTAVVSGYTGATATLKIPAKIGDYKVAAIEAGEGWGNPTTIEIPNTVERIGANAFSGCGTVVYVKIPNSVKRIGAHALEDTLWFRTMMDNQEEEFIVVGDGVLIGYCGDGATIVLPDKVQCVSSAFYGNTKVTSVTMNDSVTLIEAEAFANATSLVHIAVPDSVTEIGSDAFENTPWLNGISEEFVIVGDGVLVDYNGESERVNIPGEVKVISDAFEDSRTLREVSIPGSVKTIGDNAFANCTKLEKINISNGLENIGVNAFKSCGITSIKLPDSVKLVKEMAFQGCSSLRDVRISTGISAIYQETFYLCSAIEDIVIPSGVKYIEEGAFAYCYGLNGITVSKEMEYIHEQAFNGCGNITIYAPAGTYGSDYAQKYDYHLITR